MPSLLAGVGGVSRNPRNFRRKTSSERFSSVLLSDMVCRACFGSSIGPFGALQRCCRKSTVYRQPSPVLALLARRKNLGFGLTTPKCEFRDRILDHFARRDLLMRPRFRSDREDWVQRVVADGHAICILPERSPTVQGLVTRPIDGFVLEREVVIATVSGSTATVEIRNIAQLAARYEWN